MIRAPFSINEKTGLISIPIDINKLKQFTPKEAKMKNVEVKTNFFQIEKSEPEEAKQLFIQAFDFEQKQKPKTFKNIDYEIPKIEIQKSFFPQCITQLLSGVKQDGRKRGVFILIGFLQNMGWPYDKINKTLINWNKTNYEPLREGYIISQINWFKRQPKKLLPPNCDHESYYKTMGVKCAFCTCKNPVNYVKIKLRNTKHARKKSKR